MHVEVTVADYAKPQHAAAIVHLLDQYARDPMGGSKGLSEPVKEILVAELAKRPTAFSVLAFVDRSAAGLANCFEVFSTFAAEPVVNIHDIAVLPDYRGMGLSQTLLQKVEEVARKRGCCKLTLEVLEGNAPARRAYEKFGFGGYRLDPDTGEALFWQKPL